MIQYRVRILHISDLHQRVALNWMNEERQAEVRMDAARRCRVLGNDFRETLEKISKEYQIDFVCFTGDVANFGLREEYHAAHDHINLILSSINVSVERLFLVPGNHDIQRTIKKNAWNKLRRISTTHDQDQVSRFIGGGQTPYRVSPKLRDDIKERTAEFWSWVTKDLGRADLCPSQSPHKRFGYRALLNGLKLPFQIHIIGLDSSWLAGDDNDSGKLLLTADQINVLAKDNGRLLPGFRLALVHHPLSVLADGSYCQTLLAETVDLLLHGHQHNPIVETHENPDRAFRVLAAGCLYEGDKGDKWANSFNVIDVDLDDKGQPLRYELQFWGWSENGHWYPYGALYKQSSNGRLAWPIRKMDTSNKPPTPDHTSNLTDHSENYCIQRPKLPTFPSRPKLLIGQDRFLEEICQHVRQGGVTVLKGEGGIGKSAIARQVAYDLEELNELTGGKIWINCETHPNLNECLYQMAATFFGNRQEDHSNDNITENIISHCKNHPGLVILDNFESVISDENLLLWLSRARPPLRILLTTRLQPPIDVKTLPVPDISDKNAITLFINTAKKSNPHWGEEDNTLIKNLCSIVGNLPLALVMLGAKAAGVPLRQLYAQLQTNLDILRIGDLDHPPRHKTIQACFNMTYNSLDVEHVDLLQRISILPDGAGYGIISAIIQRSDWTDIALNLVNASVLRIRGARYIVHPLIKQFVMDRLGDRRGTFTVETALSVLHWARVQGEKTRPTYNTVERTEALDFLEAEFRNVIASINIAGQCGHMDMVSSLTDVLRDFFYIRGHLAECEKAFTKVLKEREDSADKNGLMNTRYNLGLIYEKRNNYKEATLHYIKSVAIAHDLNDTNFKGIALYGLGIAVHESAKTEEGRSMLAKLFEGNSYDGLPKDPEEQLLASVSLLDQAKNSVYLGIALSYLAVYYNDLGRKHDAEKMYLRSLDLKKSANDKEGEGISLMNLGILYNSIGSFKKAEDSFMRSYLAFQDLRDYEKSSQTQRMLARAYQSQGKWKEARKSYELAQRLVNKIAIAREKDVEKASVKNWVAKLYTELGKWKEAEDLLEECFRTFDELDERLRVGNVLLNRCAVCLLRCRWQEAEEFCLRSMEAFEACGDRIHEADALVCLGKVYLFQGKQEEAEKVCNRAIQMFTDHGEPHKQALANIVLSDIFRASNRLSQAEELCKEVQRFLHNCYDKINEGIALNSLGEIYRCGGQWSESECAYNKAIEIYDSLDVGFFKGRTRVDLARLLIDRGKFQDAERTLIKAVSILKDTEDYLTLKEADQLQNSLKRS